MVAVADRFWAVDVEGNGASPPEIVELALVEIVNLKLTGVSHRWLVRPVQPITSIANRIHGLSDADVADAPAFAAIVDEVVQLIDGVPIVGHNVRIEVDALSRAMPTWRPHSAVDTLRLAKDLKPKLESYALEKLGSEMQLSARAAKLSGERHHSALYDATLAALLFVELLGGVTEPRRGNALLDADIFDSRQASLI